MVLGYPSCKRETNLLLFSARQLAGMLVVEVVVEVCRVVSTEWV